jgi:hypothetical protein
MPINEATYWMMATRTAKPTPQRIAPPNGMLVPSMLRPMAPQTAGIAASITT